MWTWGGATVAAPPKRVRTLSPSLPDDLPLSPGKRVQYLSKKGGRYGSAPLSPPPRSQVGIIRGAWHGTLSGCPSFCRFVKNVRNYLLTQK